MEKEKFEEIITKLKYEKNKWITLHEIDSILLSNGRGLYPNWKYLKFLIADGKMFIKHGKVEAYGARLSTPNSVAGDYSYITFPRSKEGLRIQPSQFYGEGFRQPKFGDMLRITEGMEKVYGERIITEVAITMNAAIVKLSTPIRFPNTGRISFYDPTILNDAENCIHSTMDEGIYMHFIPNEGRVHKEFGSYHEVIRIKNIKEINLKVGKEYFNKTYKLD